ncbi:MAG: polyprenyl synthetase family protein, partial [Ardenticatenaceae bacterium]
MQTIISIYEPVRGGLANVRENLRELASPKFPFLAQQLDHVFDSIGKQVRPGLTLLAASFYPHDPRITEMMATAVELLHIATLIHDDTVDNSNVRRGRATISSMWGKNVAVLVGDYIFATSATFVCDTGNIRVVRRFAETIMELSTGELQEMVDGYNREVTLEKYLERTYNKTASLFTTAGESGAILSGAPEDRVKALRDYAYNIGMAYQIIDDILDFQGDEGALGKPVGNDISQGILTLPAILALQQSPNDNPIPQLFENRGDKAILRQVVDFVLNSSAIDEAHSYA